MTEEHEFEPLFEPATTYSGERYYALCSCGWWAGHSDLTLDGAQDTWDFHCDAVFAAACEDQS